MDAENGEGASLNAEKGRKVCALLCSSEAGWVQVVEGVWMKRTQLWMLGPVGCIW